MQRSSPQHVMHQSTPQLNYEWGTENGEGESTASISPRAADIAVRRSISDSVLRGGCPSVYNQKNTTFMLMSRSGGPTVKKMIAVIQERCEQVRSSSPHQQAPPPLDECSVLAQFASDAYYGVITGRQGIPTLVRAMQTWPQERGLQECCCIALGNLCCVNGNNNLIAIEQAGGVRAIINAMRLHGSSVAVQSAACDALRNMGGLILTIAQKPEHFDVKQDLEAALHHATQMYLLPLHKSIATTLLALVQQASTACPLRPL
mmetsp:Transcript_5620/g.11601  ORF Transcript_5620/g.11601 Transcript_5620/m.11601 type:complete len:261 (-) Transcript_5620:44-826(-)